MLVKELITHFANSNMNMIIYIIDCKRGEYIANGILADIIGNSGRQHKFAAYMMMTVKDWVVGYNIQDEYFLSIYIDDDDDGYK